MISRWSLSGCFHRLHQSYSSKSMSGRLPSIGLKCTNPAGLSTALKNATKCRIQCWTLTTKTFVTPAGVPLFHDPHFWNSLQVDQRPWAACLSLSHTKGHTNQQWIRESQCLVIKWNLLHKPQMQNISDYLPEVISIEQFQKIHTTCPLDLDSTA